MTTKEKILNVISSLDDDVSIEQAIDRLYLLYKIEIGLRQADAGEGMEHDTFMKQLEDEVA
jgi:predicted transcriptional regulator